MTDGTILHVGLDAGDGTDTTKVQFKSLMSLEGAQALSGIGDGAILKPGAIWVLKGEKLLLIYTATDVSSPQPPGPFDAKLPTLAKAAAALL